MGGLQELYRHAVPANARTLLGSLFGDRSPITEKNFTSEELEVIKKMHTAKAGNQTYFDYPTKQAQRGAGFTFDGPLDLIVNSYLNPSYSMMGTLGSFNTKDTPNGIEATDRYNFDNLDSYKIRKDTPHSEMLRRAWVWKDSPAGLLDMLLMRYMPELDREVKINIPK